MINLMIELTNRCTLRCPTCFSHQDNRDKHNMTFKQFKKIIDENIELIGSISLYNYGEPFLNKHLLEMIFYAKKKGVAYIKVATNGMHLTKTKISQICKSKLDYLSISLDGATEKTYMKFRVGGDFKKVLTNTQNLVKYRNLSMSKLKIEIQFIVMSHNEHEMELIEKLAKSLKVDYLRLKTVLIKKKQWNYFLPDKNEYNRYREKINNNRCFKPIEELVINCDGSVIPCCYVVAKDIIKFKLGNIFEQSLDKILNSAKYKNFTGTCTTDKSKLSSCADCDEGNLSLDYNLIKFSSR